MTDPKMLIRMHRYMQQHPEKRFLATGDIAQLEPVSIDYLNNVGDTRTYVEYCLNQMFPYDIFLNINKRLKTDEDREKLDDIMRDVFDESIPINTIINKYFKTVDKNSSNN